MCFQPSCEQQAIEIPCSAIDIWEPEGRHLFVVMQPWAIGADVLIALAVVTIWYLALLSYNRRKAQQLLHWICAASGCDGRVVCMRWSSASCFHLKLQFSAEDFREAHIKVQLQPRELPLHWLLSRLHGRQEALTFEADLAYPPAFNLEVHNYRWRKRQARRIRQADSLVLVRTGPVVLTTRGDWQQDLTNMMNGLLASRDCNFERVEFRRRSPHFSATLPLKSLDLNCEGAGRLFEALSDLAAGASAAMF